MSRVRFRFRGRVKSIDINVDPGTCLTWQNHGDLVLHRYFFYGKQCIMLLTFHHLALGLLVCFRKVIFLANVKHE